MTKKIIITGATGFIGKKLSIRLTNEGNNVIVFTRNKETAKRRLPGMTDYIEWNPMNISTWIDNVDGTDAIINLAGENLFANRWNNEHKKKIEQSRLITTRALVNAIYHSKNKPQVFISASAIGYYGFTGDAEVTEGAKPVNDFLANVTQKWELETADVESLGVRRVILRIGMVLDNNEGALAKMLPAFRIFVGGPLGNGKQWFSWIHINDLVDMFLFALNNKNINGVYNATAPNPVKMKVFAKSIGKVMHRPSIFPVPEFALKIILGEGAKYITNGSKVLPLKILASGFKFKYENAEDALESLLK